MDHTSPDQHVDHELLSLTRLRERAYALGVALDLAEHGATTSRVRLALVELAVETMEALVTAELRHRRRGPT
jgi:hypothetical protein